MKKLFVYGKLKPEYDKGADPLDNPTSDKIKADLYSFNDDAEANNFNKANDWIHGFVDDVSKKELNKLDEIEAPEYERKPVTTKSGEKAEAYEYQNKIPHDAKRLKNYLEGIGKKNGR